MESLNERLTEIGRMMVEAQALAVEYHEWDAARYLAHAIEETAQAQARTRETAIDSCEDFIKSARQSMN